MIQLQKSFKRILNLILVIGLVLFANQLAQAQEQTEITLTYTIDRSAVPTINQYDLTLVVQVGPAANITVTAADDSEIPHRYDESSGEVRFTTASESATLTFQGDRETESLGNFHRAVLRDDKAWAWSHGMDDNVNLKESIAAFEEYGWQGTLYLITDEVDDERQQDWIVDAPDINIYLENGWAIGNHTADHDCFSDSASALRTTIRTAQARLTEIVQASPRPDYAIISFASPCFFAPYQEVILDMRDSGENTLLFNESSEPALFWVDPGVSEEYTVAAEEGNEDSGYTISEFNYDYAIGRDTRIDNKNPEGIINTMDQMAIEAETGKHIWYNTITHGDNEAGLGQVLAHAYNNYGAGGTDELWVAPAENIYGYILVRDLSVVALVGGDGTEEQNRVAPPEAATAVAEEPTAEPTIAPQETAETSEVDVAQVEEAAPTESVTELPPTATPIPTEVPTTPTPWPTDTTPLEYNDAIPQGTTLMALLMLGAILMLIPILFIARWINNRE